MTESTPPYERIGYIEATVWHNAESKPPFKVTIRRIYRNNAGKWRSSPPTLTEHESTLTFLSHVAASLVNEARTKDLDGEPDVDPAHSIH